MCFLPCRTAILSTAAVLLLVLGACGKSPAHKLSPDTNDPYGASDDASPTAPTADNEDEDQLLDRLFRDAPGGKAPRLKPRATATPSQSNQPNAPVTGTSSADDQPDLSPDDASSEPNVDPNADTGRPNAPESGPTPAPVTPDRPIPPKREPTPRPKPATVKPTPAPIAPSVPVSRPKPSASASAAATAEAAPITALWDNSVEDGTQWTRMTIKALGSYGRGLLRGVPQDVQNFCPNYAALGIRGRAAFWVRLISAMAAAESEFNPKDSYTEKSHDRNGDNVVSRGLLQLSLESVQAYDCGIDSQADLEDPRKNIECSVKILNKWIVQDGVITASEDSSWLGGARYWSTLRPYNNKFDTIRKLVHKSPGCRVN